MSRFGNITKENGQASLKTPKPVLTILLICLSAAWLSSGQSAWLTGHAFTAQHFAELLSKHDTNLALYICGAVFAQLSPWLWLANSVFLWIFGSRLEQKLIDWRYPVYLSLGVLVPCILIFLDAAYGQTNKMFIGPTMFTMFLLGGYIPYLPQKPFKPAEWKQPSWKVYEDRKTPTLHELYWISPWIYVVLFVVYSIFIQCGLSLSKEQVVAMFSCPFVGVLHQSLFGFITVPMYAWTPVLALETMLLGCVCAAGLSFVVNRPTVKGAEGMQEKVLQHYRELRKLDMTHEQAVQAAARLTLVPLETARDWIAKGIAALKDQEGQ